MSIGKIPSKQKSLFGLIRDGYVGYRGRLLAKQHISHFNDLCRYDLDGKQTACVDIKGAFKRNYSKYRESEEFAVGPFERAYSIEWAALGVEDAKIGIFRGSLCGVASYSSGWLGEIDRLRKYGWINPGLNQEEAAARKAFSVNSDFDVFLKEEDHEQQ